MGPDPAQQCSCFARDVFKLGSLFGTQGLIVHTNKWRGVLSCSSPRMSIRQVVFCLLSGMHLALVWKQRRLCRWLYLHFGPETADSLTVLRNRTNMVRIFGNSVTVKNSGGHTRYFVILSSSPIPRPRQLDHSWWPPELRSSPDSTMTASHG